MRTMAAKIVDVIIVKGLFLIKSRILAIQGSVVFG